MNMGFKAFCGLTVLFVVMALALFVSAGTVAWPAGWVYLMLFAAFCLTVTLWMFRHSPGLLRERMRFRSGQNTWDKIFILALNVIFIAWLVVMPLDAVRFHWSRMPAWLQAVGALILLFSFCLFYLAVRENPYLSTTVRIQEDRGQRVVSTGPYSYVRHPYYTGSFVFFLGTTLLLGSWYGMIFVAVFVGMIAVRAVLEERLLRERLDGYDAYMAKVKYRFIPHVW